ncbi:class I SAM-dependent methyltransferase [Streptacidiphilus carbonis]|uniref:class I SAM-dependent methyltransferase n=1 Tax=Streptacidiphilus carbonis TaxID=105422 RepID=UPI0005A7CF67|nr:class I SAM-dependent methyltransferase [Streptacidiphilus carbonis]
MTATPSSSRPDSADAAEAFLRDFHNRTPGRQSVNMEAAPLGDGRTGYQVLAAEVAGARRVLDLGCADGALLEVLAAAGAEELAGIDLADGELEFARRRPALARADLRQGRAQELPFPDGSFDAVVSHMALMLMHEVEQVVAETARVLAPGGRFAVAVGGGSVPGEAMSLFLELARPYFKAVPPERSMPRLGDRRSRTREGLDELLTPAGFEPVSWQTVTIDMGGTPERVWISLTDAFYDMTALDEDQTARLRTDFLAAAPALLDPTGRIPSGMRLNLATTRLAAV